MCGICGVFRFDAPTIVGADRVGLEAMGHMQRHRGPDDYGVDVRGGCALVSQRLSILDLSPQGHMPMRSEDGRLTLVHNWRSTTTSSYGTSYGRWATTSGLTGTPRCC